MKVGRGGGGVVVCVCGGGVCMRVCVALCRGWESCDEESWTDFLMRSLKVALHLLNVMGLTSP